jgi:hypothetical protein
VLVFNVAAEYFRGFGYKDAWLLELAGECREEDPSFARRCLTAFEEDRTFYGRDVEILSSLWDFIPQIPLNPDRYDENVEIEEAVGLVEETD